jgi:voltage-gated potassium channel Kch
MSSRKRPWHRGLSVLAGLSVSARVGAIGLVFVLCVVAFASGVVTSERPELAEDSWIAWIYYAGGLFVFGGLDLGLPAGGTWPGRAALWIAYFLAPTVTTTAVAEALLKLVRPRWFQLRRLQDHLVVVGDGKIASLYVDGIRSLDPERPILSVARQKTGPPPPGVELLEGDISEAATLAATQLERAAGLVVVTDDDLVNLEVAWRAQGEEADLPIAMHVADLSLLRPVARLETEAPAPSGFNTHRIVASYLYQTRLAIHFDETAQQDVVVLAGLGRFGQTILETLLGEAVDELDQVVIVDPDASTQLRKFGEDATEPGVRITALDLDVTDPLTWDTVESTLDAGRATPVYVLCGPDVVVNLRTGMLLRGRSEEPTIFVRCFDRSPFASSLAKQQSFDLLAFETVLREALREHYHEFFRSRPRG